MSFYGIIFAILFLGACKTVLTSWIAGGDTLLVLLVTALIFNDVVNTSEAIERRKFDYTIYMKLLDLVSFFALATALILLSGDKNFLAVENIHDALPSELKHPSAPPICLFVYCMSVILWNRCSKDLWKKEQWSTALLFAAGVIVVAVSALIFLRPMRLDEPYFSCLYKVVIVAGIGATFYYLASYAFLPETPAAEVVSTPKPAPKA